MGCPALAVRSTVSRARRSTSASTSPRNASVRWRFSRALMRPSRRYGASEAWSATSASATSSENVMPTKSLFVMHSLYDHGVRVGQTIVSPGHPTTNPFFEWLPAVILARRAAAELSRNVTSKFGYSCSKERKSQRGLRLIWEVMPMNGDEISQSVSRGWRRVSRLYR